MNTLSIMDKTHVFEVGYSEVSLVRAGKCILTNFFL